LYWKLRAAGVDPRGEPVRADVGRGLRELADQYGSGKIVKAIVVLIRLIRKSSTGAAVCQQNILERSVGGHDCVKLLLQEK
jgi:hypothetical protein